MDESCRISKEASRPRINPAICAAEAESVITSEQSFPLEITSGSELITGGPRSQLETGQSSKASAQESFLGADADEDAHSLQKPTLERLAERFDSGLSVEQMEREESEQAERERVPGHGMSGSTSGTFRAHRHLDCMCVSSTTSGSSSYTPPLRSSTSYG